MNCKFATTLLGAVLCHSAHAEPIISQTNAAVLAPSTLTSSDWIGPDMAVLISFGTLGLVVVSRRTKIVAEEP